MSYDIKIRLRAIEYWDDGHSKRATAEVFKVSTTTLQKWKSQLKETGNLEPKKRRETWRKIEPVRLKEYLKQHPDAYLKEIAEEFGCSDVVVLQAFRRLKISRKKTTLYKEISESSRQKFVDKLKTVSPESLVYVDETGIDQCLYREYARAPRGQKVVAKISGRKFKRTNIVAGICQGKWVAPLEYTGTTDSILFEFWFENCLLKEVAAGSTIIPDNATFHKKAVLTSLAASYHCEIIFLPPYSPDLNPIEKKWAWLKCKLREVLHLFDSFEHALWNTFQLN